MVPPPRLALGWPPLHHEATLCAVEAYEAYVETCGGDPGLPGLAWPSLLDEDQAVWINSQLGLLRDLSRPAARDHWFRYLAVRRDVSTNWRDEPTVLLHALLSLPGIASTTPHARG